MNQGEAVFQAVSQVFESGAVIPPTSQWTEGQKEKVNAIVFSFFKSGEAVHKANPNDTALMKYIPGLVNNWVRKDKRLNGGIKYEAKRPGSRSGSGDESVKAMRSLLAVTTDSKARAEIQAEIERRLADLKPKTVIDAAKLPESLRYLVAQ